jgi:hypothetical protein
MSPSTRRDTISRFGVVPLGVHEQGGNQQRLLHHLADHGNPSDDSVAGQSTLARHRFVPRAMRPPRRTLHGSRSRVVLPSMQLRHLDRR